MEREEAALRAKIQAVKNLLQAKQPTPHHHASRYHQRAPVTSFAKPYSSYYSRKPAPPGNKTWTRSGAAATTGTNSPIVNTQSANRVWLNASAVRTEPVRVSPVASASRPPSQPPRQSFAKRVRNRMQLQVLRLEDGEYAKANGGFSLVRSDALKAKADELTKRAPLNATNRRPSLVTASTRAQLVVNRARATTRSRMAKSRVRTEYCRFFNKFGYCKNKNACKDLHDSRRVALCRNFARGSCTGVNCLLSHDKNKMPVCTMFLRGACTRDDCRFRHVKVSGSAPICEAFMTGYCPQGASCTKKHELPARKRSLSAVVSTNVTRVEGASSKQPKLDPPVADVAQPGTLSIGDDSKPCSRSALDCDSSGMASDPSPTSGTSPATSSASTLSIRPNIRFAPRHTGIVAGFLSLRRKPAAQQELD